MKNDQWLLLQSLGDAGEIYAIDLEAKEGRLLTVQEYLLLTIAATLRHLSINVDTST